MVNFGLSEMNNSKQIRNRALKAATKILRLSFFILFIALSNNIAQNNNEKTTTGSSSDSLKLIEQYSLFSEYYKNKDFETALPYGWKVLKMDPQKFSKYIYFKLEDILWTMHDSSTIAPEIKKSIEDTILYVYDLALKFNTADKAYFEPRKAFVEEDWLKLCPDIVIKDYEKAIADDPNTSTYYYNRLGQLYITNMSDQNDYKTKALDLYTLLSEREPDNPQWNSELEGLAENIEEMVALNKKAWDLDKNNLEKAWKYASLSLKAELYTDAINALEFLVNKSPSTVNYWNQLATAYQKTDNFNKAEEAYKELINLEPDKKENYLFLGILYKDRGQLSLARKLYLQASDIGNGWALPVLYEGLLYEQSARNCEFNFETKLVYLLAVETYRKALRMDPALTQAGERISALGSSIPQRDDYFFRGYKSGQTLPITGVCYGWIGKSVTIHF